MKTIIFTAIASAFISISAYHFIVEPETFYEDTQTCESSSQPELELSTKVSVLQQEKPVAQQPSKFITKSGVVSLPTDSDDKPIKNEKDLQELEALKMEKKAEPFNGWLKESITKNPGFDLNKYLENHFSTEIVDSDWAPTQENKLAPLIRDMYGVTLRVTCCGSTTLQCV